VPFFKTSRESLGRNFVIRQGDFHFPPALHHPLLRMYEPDSRFVPGSGIHLFAALGRVRVPNLSISHHSPAIACRLPSVTLLSAQVPMIESAPSARLSADLETHPGLRWTDFRGWQVQPGERPSKGELQAALGRVSGESPLPQGSGRTDAGVHALAQIASFALLAPIPPATCTVANRTLPQSIRVSEATTVPEHLSCAPLRDGQDL